MNIRTRTWIAASADEDDAARRAATPIARPAPRTTDRPNPGSIVMAGCRLGRATAEEASACRACPDRRRVPAARHRGPCRACRYRPRPGCRRAAPEERPAPAGPAPEVGGPRPELAADADAPPRPGEPGCVGDVPRLRARARPSTGSTRQPPQDAVYRRPGGSTAFFAPGWVPLMNHSLIVSRVQGPGLPPVHASIRAWTTPFGGAKLATGCLFVRSRTKACHSGAAAVSEIAGWRERGFEWSLLPIQSPIASAGAVGSLGGARKPYVARSRASFAVPVFAATGRRCAGRPVLDLEDLRPDRVLVGVGVALAGCRRRGRRPAG